MTKRMFAATAALLLVAVLFISGCTTGGLTKFCVSHAFDKAEYVGGSGWCYKVNGDTISQVVQVRVIDDTFLLMNSSATDYNKALQDANTASQVSSNAMAGGLVGGMVGGMLAGGSND